MNTTHRTHRHQHLATGAGLIVTLAMALTASDAPRADAIIAPSMAAALQDMNGTNGWLLKRGNTVLSSKNADFVFEPASAIKFIIHLKAELMIQSNWASPVAPISGTNVYDVNNLSCPVDSNNNWTEPLEDAMSKMMWASDNSRTKALVEYFGEGAINGSAQWLGAVNTSINHTHGCGGEALANPNETTLNDMTTLYRKAFTGNLLTPARLQHMWALMPNQLQELRDTANYVAWSSYGQALTGPPKAFRDNLKVATKAGGYTLCPNNVCNQYYRSIAGYVEIPFKTGYGTILPQKYTFGIFIHKATKTEDDVDEAFQVAIRTLFREEMDKALGTFF